MVESAPCDLDMLIDHDWYEKHKNDYTQEQIDSLGIQLSFNGKQYPAIRQGGNKGKVKKLVEAQRGIKDG